MTADIEEPHVSIGDDSDFCDYEVTCARCGVEGMATQMVAEEGDEWECPPCNAKWNSIEKARIQKEPR